MIGVTYKTAWFLCHRIRLAMTPQPGTEPKLQGIVEVDETFVGPKARRKTPVVALVERQGLAPGESGGFGHAEEPRRGVV